MLTPTDLGVPHQIVGFVAEAMLNFILSNADWGQRGWSQVLIQDDSSVCDGLQGSPRKISTAALYNYCIIIDHHRERYGDIL